jgi:hypothetical protein
MTTEQFQSIVTDWLAKAKDKRWNRAYTELSYEPMLEVMKYLRDNGYRTYIVTGGARTSFVPMRSRYTAYLHSRSSVLHSTSSHL